MTGCRTVVGLSLLSALLFCAFAAQSASAKGTTAYTCVKVASAKTGEFADAHCNVPNAKKEGEYNHVKINAGEKTEVEVTNEKTFDETKATTPVILRGIAGGITFEVQCTNFTGFATIKNVEIEKVMQVEGTEIRNELRNCTVLRPENSAEERHPCKVEEPIMQTGTSLTKENLGTGKEMGVEFKPAGVGIEPFANLSFTGTNCALKGVLAKIEGSAIATGSRGSSLATTSSGATLAYTTAMTESTLHVFASGKPAEVSANFILRMKPTKEEEEKKENNTNVLTLTTTEP